MMKQYIIHAQKRCTTELWYTSRAPLSVCQMQIRTCDMQDTAQRKTMRDLVDTYFTRAKRKEHSGALCDCRTAKRGTSKTVNCRPSDRHLWRKKASG